MTSTQHGKSAIEMELAGLASIPQGLIGADRGEIRAPRRPLTIELEHDHLVYRFDVDAEVERQLQSAITSKDAEAFRSLFDQAAPPAPSTDGALDAFMTIDDGGSAVRFAQKWGPLLLCPHGVPAPHAVQLVSSADFPGFGYVPRADRCEAIGSEAVDAWVTYAEWAAELARLAAGHDDLGDPEKLLVERYMSEMLSYWLAVSETRPRVRWFSGQASIGLSGEGVWPVLGLQLCSVITGSRGVAICTACGHAYLPQRKPQRGRLNYCARPECQKVGAKRRTRKSRSGR